MSTSSLPVLDVTRFHLSMNVNDLTKSVRFLTALFGCPPKRLEPDYAKFEPADLPVVLSLEPRSAPQPPLRNTAGEGPLNHVGIRMADPIQLVEVQRRLEAADYSTQREDGVECCYARQTKFWVHDHDRTMWEVYVLEEDLDHRGGQHEKLHVHSSRHHHAGEQALVPQRTWTHRLSNEFPATIPGSGELDEVVLQGTWNAARHRGEWESQLVKVASALRPGGKLVVHVLTSNAPVSELDPLPGPASVVQVVPQLHDVLKAVEYAGFTYLHFQKYAGAPCFTQKGIEMRETRLEAVTLASDAAGAQSVRVLYRGPLARVIDDQGVEFTRGEIAVVPQSTWHRIASGAMAESFVKLAEPATCASCCSS